MSDPTSEPPQARPWQRHLLLALALVAVVHSAILVIWLSPSGPVRDSIGDRRLETYVNPYFGQAWGAMAPNAQFVDETFRFRARVKDDVTGKVAVTDWIDVTSMDDAMLRHDVRPSRVHSIARRLATNLNGAMYGLDAQQRALVKTSYGKLSPAELESRLVGLGRIGAVRSYLTYDQMATRFASMYAAATFEGRVVAVQYRIGRRTVPSADRRDGQDVRDEKFAWFEFGYRGAFKATYEAQSAFDDYVGRQAS